MASAVIGALHVDLSLGTAEFEEGAKKAKDKAKKTAGGIQSAFAGLKSIFTPFNIGVASAIGALTGLTLGIKDNIEHFDKLIKTARQIGLPVDQFSALTFAADQSGISMEELARGMRNVARNVAGGSAQFTEALSAIGLSLDEFAGLGQQERLLLLADKFSILRESGNKTALAMRLVGEEMGPRFINLLNNGRAGLIDYIAEAEQLGVTIDEDTAKASERFNDNLDRLGRNIKNIARSIAAGLIPALADLSDKMVEIVNFDLGAEVDKIDKKFGNLVVNSLNQAGLAFQQFAVMVLGGRDALRKFNAQLLEAQRRQELFAQQVVNRAAKGDLETPGVPLPGRGDRKLDAPSVRTPEQIAAARQAEAQATRDLLTAENALNQLRMEFATPEEERALRLEKLHKALSGLKEGSVEAAEAHMLYERAARSMQAGVTDAYLGMASSVAGSLSQIFTKVKGFAVAQAIIDTYSAFNSALANPPGPPFSYAQAFAALASGFARVRSILSTNPGTSTAAGTGGGGGGGGAGGAAPQAAPRQAVNLTLHGQRFSRDDVLSLMTQMNDLVSDGAVLNVRAA